MESVVSRKKNEGTTRSVTTTSASLERFDQRTAQCPRRLLQPFRLSKVTVHSGVGIGEGKEHEHCQGCSYVWFVISLSMSLIETVLRDGMDACTTSQYTKPCYPYTPHDEVKLGTSGANPVLTRSRYWQRRLIPSPLRRPYCRCNRPFLADSQSRVRGQSGGGSGGRATTISWRPLG